MNLKSQTTILLLGDDIALSYLIGRLAELGGYQLTTPPKDLSIKEIVSINPTVIIFSSIEYLETTQNLVGELASLDSLVMVCSSVPNEGKARELGVDFYLQHPLTFEVFQAALTSAGTSKRA